MVDTVSDIEELLIYQRLTDVKAKYCRMVDNKDWAGFEALFTPDATLDFRGGTTTSVGNAVLCGSEAIVETISNAVANLTTVHQCHTPEFEILSPTSARALWHMADQLRWPEGSPVRAKSGYGYYHETYEKVDGAWKICAVRLERILVEEVSVG